MPLWGRGCVQVRICVALPFICLVTMVLGMWCSPRQRTYSSWMCFSLTAFLLLFCCSCPGYSLIRLYGPTGTKSLEREHVPVPGPAGSFAWSQPLSKSERRGLCWDGGVYCVPRCTLPGALRCS